MPRPEDLPKANRRHVLLAYMGIFIVRNPHG